MKILILDDDNTRHNEFAISLWNHDLTHVSTFKDFEKATLEFAFDIVFLDYDLNFGNSSLKPDGSWYTGEDAAKALGFLAWRPRLIVVHSWNEDGRADIADVLENSNFRHVIEAFPCPKIIQKINQKEDQEKPRL